MSYIILPSRRTRQPQGAVRPRWNSFKRSPTLFWDGAIGLDWITASRGTITGATFGTVGDALGYNFPNSASQGIIIGSTLSPTTIYGTVHSILVIANARSQNTQRNCVINQRNTGPFSGVAFNTSANPYLDIEQGCYSYCASYSGELYIGATISGAITGRLSAYLLSRDNLNFLGSVDGATKSVSVGSNGAPNYSVPSIGYELKLGDLGDFSTAGFGYQDGIAAALILPCAVSQSEANEITARPWDYLFAPHSRRLYFGASGGGATATNERTVAARTKARGAATTTAIHAATTAGRIRARAADAVVPIHVETVSGRVIARGADARTSIHTGTSAGRVKARAANTVEHIDAGAVSRTIAGKVRARGAAATLAIRHTSIVGRVKAKAAETGTSTRLSLAAGRVRTRAAIAAAPVVPGMVFTTAAGRIQARGAVATTATRIEAIAGRVTARGTDTANSIRTAVTAGRLRSRGRATAGPYVAPTLPLEIPPSTRTIDRDPTRLGRSPLSPTKPRLG